MPVALLPPVTQASFPSLPGDWYLDVRIDKLLYEIRNIYYPIVAAVGVPINLVTIVVLSRGKCGLSTCVTRYLVAMAAADLLVVIIDVILRQIPMSYRKVFAPVHSLPVCNIHAVLLYAVTDCSVWFTVTFTFDRFVAICCQKLKTKYCTKKTAAVVLGTVTVMSCLKNVFWYFMLTDAYGHENSPWLCLIGIYVHFSPVWGAIELLHHILTPGVPFVLILLLNAVTVSHILVASRARRRLRGPCSGESPRDPEMESRRKSIILLFALSCNFILLWSVLMMYSIYNRVWPLVGYFASLPHYFPQLAKMLQLLSCCTNTCIYAVTQTRFRQQLINVVKDPFTLIVKFIKG